MREPLTGQSTPTDRHVVIGTISSTGTEAGHRFVIGAWARSPLGPMHDVMWVRPDGTRVLLAPTEAVADFVTAIYTFDEVRVTPITLGAVEQHSTVHVDDPALDLRLEGGRLRPIPLPRPRWVTRRIEGPIAARLMGVTTYGTSARGAVEWYQTRGWRWVNAGVVTLEGHDLGAPAPLDRPLRVGFSEPPRRPSIVKVRVTIDLPPGRWHPPND